MCPLLSQRSLERGCQLARCPPLSLRWLQALLHHKPVVNDACVNIFYPCPPIVLVCDWPSDFLNVGFKTTCAQSTADGDGNASPCVTVLMVIWTELHKRLNIILSIMCRTCYFLIAILAQLTYRLHTAAFPLIQNIDRFKYQMVL